MKYYLIASGSKGNCLLVGYNYKWLVIDCGISQKYFLDCLDQLQIELKDLVAVIISHGHRDHFKKLKCLSQIPLYGNGIEAGEINYNQDFMIDSFLIKPLLLSHDYLPTYGFRIEVDNQSLCYVTDTGYLRQSELEKLINCDYIILESNYDEELLLASSRSWYLKQRIMSSKGHLSNQMVKQYLDEIVGCRTKDIILAHISQEVNNIDNIRKVFKDYSIVRVAKQYEIIGYNV